MEGEKINQSKIEYSVHQERIQRLEQVLQEIEVDLNRLRQELKEAIER